jgi:hypothetical protein
MEIQERILSKVHSLKGQIGFIRNEWMILSMALSNKYKYHETLDFEESITTSKKPLRKTLF